MAMAMDSATVTETAIRPIRSPVRLLPKTAPTMSITIATVCSTTRTLNARTRATPTHHPRLEITRLGVGVVELGAPPVSSACWSPEGDCSAVAALVEERYMRGATEDP